MSLFRRTPPREPATAQKLSPRSPVTDPATGESLAPKQQPGYYPGFSTLAQERYWDAATRLTVNKRLQTPPPLRFFTPEEAATMRSVADRILPQEDRTQDRRISILPGIDERLHLNRIEGYRYADMPSDQDAYRLGAKAIEQMAQEEFEAPFHELDTGRQEQLLQSLHDGKPLGAKDLWSQLNLSRFWDMLVADCCSVYYAHPWAWDEIGYGGPAYPRGYMRLEDGEAEPWEVNEKRYDWSAPADSISDRAQKERSHPSHSQGGTH